MYIAIINYNMGNIKSVENAFRKIGAEIKVTSDPEVINSSSATVLPGVGAFKDAINNLEGLELIDVIKENINKKLFLGICLGMQLLYEYSMEDGKSRGLGVLKGFVGKIPSVVKVPHMGWNQIKIINKNNKLFFDIDNGENFYFIHSYHIIPENRNVISSITDYGIEIVSSIEKGDIYGFQFHPEKSSTIGLKILNNFWKLVKENS